MKGYSAGFGSLQTILGVPGVAKKEVLRCLSGAGNAGASVRVSEAHPMEKRAEVSMSHAELGDRRADYTILQEEPVGLPFPVTSDELIAVQKTNESERYLTAKIRPYALKKYILQIYRRDVALHVYVKLCFQILGS